MRNKIDGQTNHKKLSKSGCLNYLDPQLKQPHIFVNVSFAKYLPRKDIVKFKELIPWFYIFACDVHFTVL